MTTPLDRIRVAAGVPATSAVRATPRAPLGRVGIADALAARRGAPVDIRSLRVPAAAAALGLIGLAYGPAVSWVYGRASDKDFFIYTWIIAVVSFVDINQWGHLLALGSLVAIVTAAIWTEGITA